jgi:alkylated DNA repair dioxygenase AlkB
METLFPLDRHYPEGFSYYPAFISEAEEKHLLNAITNFKLHTFHFQGYEAKRKVASFGHDWSFETRTLSKGKEIPVLFDPLIEKVVNHIALKKEDVGELLITEYPVGAVINWHRDAPPFDLIAGISLQTDCTFKLRPFEKARQNRSSIISIPVKRRSLYVMQGESRTNWQHSISPVKEVRYSITLRTLKA